MQIKLVCFLPAFENDSYVRMQKHANG